MAPACPTRTNLVAYAVGRLSEAEAAQVECHLANCPSCEATVTDLDTTSDALLAACHRRQTVDPLLAEPELEQALDRISALTEPSHSIGPTARQQIGELASYEIERPIGRGGMGTVYLARHRKLGKRVALKLLPPEMLRDPDGLRRFEREMKAVGKLSHPNIVAAFDAGESAGQHYLAMELVDGLDVSTIAHRLQSQGGVAVADACELIRQAALGLEHANQHGLVHRDLKPSNLILGGPGRTDAGHGLAAQVPPTVKILDFGLALLDEHREDNSERTTAGLVMGTVDYMAPEQANDSHDVDIRSDLYSLGATLYRLLAGQPPFAGRARGKPIKQLVAKALEPAPSLAQARPDLPAALVAIVDRLLATQPEDRIATPADLAQALAPFARDADLAALLARATLLQAEVRPTPVADDLSPPTCQHVRQPRPSSRRTIWSMAAVTLLVLAATLIVYRLATDNGELVIRSDEPGVEISIRRNGQPVKHLEITQEPTTTRVRSGTIDVVIRGANADSLVATNDQNGTSQFNLVRNGKVVVEIVRQAMPPQVAAEPAADPAPKLAAESKSDRDLIDRIFALNGTVEILEANSHVSFSRLGELPPGQLHVTSINLHGKKLDDAFLDQLPGRTHLRELRIGATSITDVGLDRLRELPQLAVLELSRTQVTDKGLESLGRLTGLRDLNLMITPVTNDGLRHLRNLRRLETLDLDYDGVDDSGLEHLLALTNLESLHVCGSQIDDAGLQRLASLKRLRDLRMDSARITGAGLAHLKQLPRLECLFLQNTLLGSPGLEHLAGLHRLSSLAISRTSISDSSLVHLEGLTELKSLYLGENHEITDQGLNHLLGLKQLSQLALTDTGVSDAGIPALSQMQSLRALDLQKTRVTEEGVSKLRGQLPAAQIAR